MNEITATEFLDYIYKMSEDEVNDLIMLKDMLKLYNIDIKLYKLQEEGE